MKKDETYKQVVFSDKKIKTYEKTIKESTAEKKRQLNRALDNMVDKVFNKKYQLFLKDIKIKKDLQELKKVSDELTNFKRSYESKLEALKDAVKSKAKKVEVICERQSRKSTREGQELDKLDEYARNLLLTLSYPNLMARAVDLNEALGNGSNMLNYALNPNTLKQIEN